MPPPAPPEPLVVLLVVGLVELVEVDAEPPPPPVPVDPVGVEPPPQATPVALAPTTAQTRVDREEKPSHQDALKFMFSRGRARCEGQIAGSSRKAEG